MIKAWPLPCQRARHTSTVGNGKLGISEKIALLLHPHVDVPYSFVVTKLEFERQIVSIDVMARMVVEKSYIATDNACKLLVVTIDSVRCKFL